MSFSVKKMLDTVTRLKNILEDNEVGLAVWHLAVGNVLLELKPYVDAAEKMCNAEKSQQSPFAH